jgi:hypothetical protein
MIDVGRSIFVFPTLKSVLTGREIDGVARSAIGLRIEENLTQRRKGMRQNGLFEQEAPEVTETVLENLKRFPRSAA